MESQCGGIPRWVGSTSPCLLLYRQPLPIKFVDQRGILLKQALDNAGRLCRGLPADIGAMVHLQCHLAACCTSPMLCVGWCVSTDVRASVCSAPARSLAAHSQCSTTGMTRSRQSERQFEFPSARAASGVQMRSSSRKRPHTVGRACIVDHKTHSMQDGAQRLLQPRTCPAASVELCIAASAVVS